MRNLRNLALTGIIGVFSLAGTLPMSAAVTHLTVLPDFHAQVVVATPGIAIGWYNGRYYDGHRYWARREWYAAHPGWNGGWGPGWNYHPGVVVGAPGPAIGWYSGRYYDGHRYWARREWYAAHPGWRGGWGPGWHYRP